MSIKKSIYEELILESNDRERSIDLITGVIAFEYFEDIFSPTITAKAKVVNNGNVIAPKNNPDGDKQSIYNGRHAEGSYHYSNQAFDIPFYSGNNIKKGVTDDAKGETKLSSMLRADLIAGGFNGPQLGGSSIPAQISAPPKPSQPAQITPERKGSQVTIIDDSQPVQQPQVPTTNESTHQTLRTSPCSPSTNPHLLYLS